MEDGALFRQLRQNRHITLAQCADHTVSVAAISKFERGEMAISFHRFERLLQKIEVPIEEFVFLRAQKAGTTTPVVSGYMRQEDLRLDAIYKKMSALTATRHVTTEVIRSFDAEKARYQPNDRSPTNRERFSALIIDLLQDVLTRNQETHCNTAASIDMQIKQMRARTRPLVRYLHAVDDWGYFELRFFMSLHIFIDPESTHQFVPTVTRFAQRYQGFHAFDLSRYDLLVGMFTDFLNAGRADWSQEILDLIGATLAKDDNMTEANRLLFCTGWQTYQFADKTQGLEKMNQAISIARILKQQRQLSSFQASLQVITTIQKEGHGALFFT